MSDTVLSKALIGHEGMLRKLGLVMGGSLFIAMAAQISVGWPVPMTLQTLAILIVGFGLGARLLTGSYYGQTIQIWSALFMAAICAAALVGLLGLAQRVTLRRMGLDR